MKLRYPIGAATLFMFCSMCFAKEFGPPASLDQKNYLTYLLMMTPKEQERNAVIYRVLELARGVEMYRSESKSKKANKFETPGFLRDLQSDGIFNAPLLPPRDEAEYVKEKSKQIDRYLQGNPISDLLLRGVVSVAAARVSARASGPVADFLRSFVQNSGDAFLKDIKSRYSLKSDHEVIQKAVNLLYSPAFDIKSPAGLKLASDIKSSLQIDLWSDLSQDPRAAAIVAQKGIKNLEASQKYLMKEIQLKFDGDKSGRYQSNDLNAESSDEFGRQIQVYEAWKKSMQERRDDLRAFFRGVYAVGQIVSLNDEQMRAVEDFSRLSQIVHDLDSGRYDNQPMQEASLYIMAAQIIISYWKTKDAPENPLAGLYRQVHQLAVRLEAVRGEMHNRFSMVDFAIARHFDQTFSVLRAIQRDTSDQLLILGALSDNFGTLQQTVDDYFKALADRHSDTILAECLSGATLPTAQVAPCLRKAEMIAVKWPKDRIETDPFNPAQVSNDNLRLSDQASLYSSHLPWLERFATYWGHDNDYFRDIVKKSASPVVNPDSWMTGSALFTHVMLAKPDVTSSYPASIYDEFINQGTIIQEFFRNLVFDGSGKLKVSLIGNVLRMHEQKMQEAARAYAAYLRTLPPLPLKSNDQELPEEVVSDEDRARSSSNRGDPDLPLETKAPRNHLSFVQDEKYFVDVKPPLTGLPRLSDRGRGQFGMVEGKSKPELLSEAVRLCPGYSHALPWPSSEGFAQAGAQHERLRSMFTIPENTLLWDNSILPLIPRAALWADRVIEGGKLIACVTNQYSQLHSFGPAGGWRYYLTIEVKVEFEGTFKIADKSVPRRFRVATLKARMRPHHPTAGTPVTEINTVSIRALWNGGTTHGVPWGPMRGNFDRVFFVVQDATAQIELTQLSTLLLQEIESRRVELFRSKERPDIKKGLNEARAYRSLLAAILRQGIAETSPYGIAAIEPLLMHRRNLRFRVDPKDSAAQETFNVRLMTPESLILNMADGYSAEEITKLLSAQTLRYLRDVSRIEESKPKAARAKTPVDEQLALLRALKGQHEARLRLVSMRQ